MPVFIQTLHILAETRVIVENLALPVTSKDRLVLVLSMDVNQMFT